ncbi:MAG TPA: AMP-binding protein [Acidimicrobiia bacterium]|nr:AMP-binding protein [Acidimicrobiia bacterium]
MTTYSGPRTLGAVVAARAAAGPDRVLIDFEDRSVTYGVLDDDANRFANRLGDLGIAKGDKVAIMLDNCPEFLAAWVGTAKAGIVEVPINTGYKGDLFAYLLNQAEVRAIVVDPRWVERLEAVAGDLETLEHVIAVGDDVPAVAGTTGHTFGGFLDEGDPDPPDVEVAPEDTATILFTSGTTGPSKGAVRSHRANFAIAEATITLMDYAPGEVFFTVFPMFHVNAKTNTVIPALILDGRIVMHARFSASSFWDTTREHGVTAFNYMGALLMMLHKQPPRPDDADNPVRKAYGAPAPVEIFEDFQDRFGVDLVEVYGSTECGIVTYNTIHEMRLGTCGRAAPYYDVELHDELDNPVPPGVPGEIVVRPREPFIMFTEYYRNPEATAEAFRNLWYHTGDRAVMDEDGYYTYLDRIKDSIRRRGENISSWEVERVINSIEEVQEAAVVGVPSELTEEEVLAIVVPKPGADIAPERILDEVNGRMPHFAVPRYVRFVAELPKSPAQRIQKFRLREEGLTGDTWDREDHGYVVTR